MITPLLLFCTNSRSTFPRTTIFLNFDAEILREDAIGSAANVGTATDEDKIMAQSAAEINVLIEVFIF
jgi:hypothetical protein